MTHDELLAKMKKLSNYYVYEPCQEFESAIYAIVELHKASKVEGRWGKVRLCCLRCQTNYPCPTIQAIEKELK